MRTPARRAARWSRPRGPSALGCAGGRDLATKLANSAVPSHLPLVMACWEKEFEASGFRGEYRATIGFVVSQEPLEDPLGAKVSKLDGTDTDPERDQGGLPRPASRTRSTRRRSLDGRRRERPRLRDIERPLGDRLRDRLRGRVLQGARGGGDALGARAPRPSLRPLPGPLHARSAARGGRPLHRDRPGRGQRRRLEGPARRSYARSLQRAYDLHLELRDRLRSAISATDLPEANRKRLRSEIEETEAKARGIGAAIGCKMP